MDEMTAGTGETRPARILICDDEPDIVSALKIYLESDGYETVTAKNGREALRAVNGGGIDLILLDIMMPEMDGIQALVQLRESENLPVILLTAKSEDADKILGLNLGADDYVTKPFHPAEVLARVRSQLRRYLQLGGRTADTDTYVIGGIELNDREKRVTLDGESVALTPTEFDILKLLMSQPGRVLSPKEIYRQVWQGEAMGSENTVAVHIRHLREKIEIDPAQPRHLKVVWGQGYKMERGGRE
jgi:DNA-binding response OmpR family regulator